MRSNNFDINFPGSLHTEVEALAKNYYSFKQRGWPLIIQFVIFELRGYWYIDMLEMAQNRFEALPQVQD